MKGVKRGWVVVAAAALLGGAGALAQTVVGHAYYWTRVGDTSTAMNDAGAPDFWANPSALSFCFDDQYTNTSYPWYGGDTGQYASDARNAISGWTSQVPFLRFAQVSPGSSCKIVFQGAQVYQSSNQAGDAWAHCTQSYSNGQCTKAVIQVDFDFFADPEKYDNQAGWNSQVTDTYATFVMMHELGHALLLNHSCSTGNSIMQSHQGNQHCPTEPVYPCYYDGSNCPVNVLSDDSQALFARYPQGSSGGDGQGHPGCPKCQTGCTLTVGTWEIHNLPGVQLPDTSLLSGLLNETANTQLTQQVTTTAQEVSTIC